MGRMSIFLRKVYTYDVYFLMTTVRRTARLSTSRGFTLIELLVVIAIIGILATIVLVSLTSAQAKSRDAKRAGDLQELSKLMSLNSDPRVTFAGGGVNVAPYIKLNAVTVPTGWFTPYSDPSFASTAGSACQGTAGTPSTSKCQYSLTGQNGSYAPTVSTQNYEICAYFETAYGPLANTGAGGLVHIGTDGGGNIMAGCN